MSILTKIFVVLVTIFSVALVGMMVSFVARTEDWKSKYEDEKARANSADTTARFRQEQIKQLTDKESERVAMLSAEKNRLDAELSALQTRANAAAAELAEVSQQKNKSEADVSQLTSAVKLLTDINQSVKQELDKRREEVISSETKRIQLADRNNELQGQVDTLQRERKSLNERLVALEKSLDDLRMKVTSAAPTSDSVTPAPPSEFVPDVAIRGQVVATDKADSVTFVKINVGSTDRVRENTKFIIHRGNTYVGTMVVTNVDSKASAGRLTLGQGEIKPGDEVLAGPTN